MVRIRFDSRKSGVNEDFLWVNEFPYDTVPIFIGKKAKNVVDLLAALELRGSSTTKELASFAITSHYTKGELDEMGVYFVKRRAHYYWNHLHGFVKDKSGKRGRRYQGLLSGGYAKIIDSERSNIHIYFATLPTHLISLGYKFNDSELEMFIKNASTNSLYFAFLNYIIKKISLGFVKRIFLIPICEMIKSQRIRFDSDYRLNFDLIASATAMKIHQEISKTWQEMNSYDPKTDTYSVTADYELLKQIDILIKNTWFDLHADSKWVGQLIELYYPTEKQRMFYGMHSDLSDKDLIYKVMREIHVNYYNSYREKIPVKYQQKFPLPIRRKREKKKEPTRKTPKFTPKNYHFW